MATISFAARTHPHQSVLEFVPVVDGVKLTELVTRFKQDHGMDRAGGYGGLMPKNLKVGTANAYCLGLEGAFLYSARVPLSTVQLLGCKCGEWGCKPLWARVLVERDTVAWTNFHLPHRPDRDYRAFGPFVFRRQDYEEAIDATANRWRSPG